MDLPVYTPPCWVNPTLQQFLLTSKSQDIYLIAKQLWEASGGQECGFDELQKYLNHINFHMSQETLRRVWLSLSLNPETSDPPSPPEVQKKSLSPLALEFQWQKKCFHCGEIFSGFSKEKNICPGCDHALQIVSDMLRDII